ncbi:MAG: hypothetical protein ACLQOO_01275 [Terriglobia bacterium]
MEVSDASDEQLWQVCRKLPTDFEPYGERKWGGKLRDKRDCGTCRWFQPLLRPGQLVWGTCVNPDSPRAGLLTFWEQGCEQFEEEQERGTEDMHRNRSEFKDRVEDMLREPFGAFTNGEITKVNGLPEKKTYLAWHWEQTIEMKLDLMLYLLLKKTTGDFDRRKAAEEMIAETRQESERFWEAARRGFARIDKRDVSTIRLPDNRQGLEDQFWERVEVAIMEALVGKRYE